jgi:hypothetical protein
MMRGPWPMVIAVVAAGLLAAALGWLIVSEAHVGDPGPVTAKLKPLEALSAELPAIEAFTYYKINDENPFVPYAARVAETTHKETVKSGVRPPPPEVRVPVATGPDWESVRLGSGAAVMPQVFGILASSQGTRALVSLPGSTSRLWLAVGESAMGWKLSRVIDDWSVTVTSEQGESLDVRIGEAGSGVDAGHAAAKKVSKPAKGSMNPSDILAKIKPGPRPGTVLFEGKVIPVADIVAGRVPGITVTPGAQPGTINLNGVQIPADALRSLNGSRLDR